MPLGHAYGSKGSVHVPVRGDVLSWQEYYIASSEALQRSLHLAFIGHISLFSFHLAFIVHILCFLSRHCMQKCREGFSLTVLLS
jgi:hypothetical protein